VEVVQRHQQVRWRMRRGYVKETVKPFVIEPSHYTAGEPISGSVEYDDLAKTRSFEYDLKSLQARGFYRFQKEYVPSKDTKNRIISLAKSCNLKASNTNKNEILNYQLSDAGEKYELLTKANEEFQHSVPNSLLYMIRTVGDAVEFYETPVNTNTPYEELLRSENLPPNLHIQKEPLRFHPDTDSMFGGVTAFTKSSTIVTGLRAKQKYKGFKAQKYWPPEDVDN